MSSKAVDTALLNAHREARYCVLGTEQYAIANSSVRLVTKFITNSAILTGAMLIRSYSYGTYSPWPKRVAVRARDAGGPCSLSFHSHWDDIIASPSAFFSC